MSTLSRLICTLVVSLAITGCGTSGDVVKVTKVKNSQIDGIKEKDLEKIKEIKKARKTKQGIDTTLSNVIEKTRHFSASEYIRLHPDSMEATGSDYKIGSFDVLSITVYEEKDLSREAVPVSGKGYISFPLIGRIKVDDLTVSQIDRLISRRLAKEQYLLDAHVSVIVTEYNSKRFLVLGAVNKPGSYSLKARERVLDGISRAGGIAGGIRRARGTDVEQAGKKAMIIRTENLDGVRERKVVIAIDLQGLLKGKDQISNISLKDKDTLFIPKAERFYIIGQVKHPASYFLPDKEITLVEAISMAGGFTTIAARNRTRIIRVEDGTEKIIQVQVDAITKAGKKIQDVLIKPGDVIVVPESFF